MRFDAIIIGAGPGGLACATRLAAAGREVLVLEKKDRIGPKICAGGITWSGLASFFPATLISRSFRRQRIINGGTTATLQTPEPMVVTMDRGTLGRWMRQRALAAGATIHTGEQVTAICKDTVQTTGASYQWRQLIGADGSNSLVRRLLGLSTNRVGFGIQYWLEESLPHMEWHLNPRYFGSGYGWIFPHAHRTSVGGYCDRNHIAPRILKKNVDRWLENAGISVKGLQPEAALINFDYQGWRFGRVALVGDAAGFASALTGEGIFPAIISGLTAAEAILQPDRNPERFLQGMLRSHRHHRFYQRLAATCPLAGRLLAAVLLIGLRKGFIRFSALEMGSDTPALLVQGQSRTAASNQL